MKEIQLTQGKVTQVDDEDFEQLNKWNWYASFERGRWYAARDTGVDGTIRLHRFVCKALKYTDVDHIDNDGLNNQKSNLRVCSRSENLRNSKLQRYRNYKGAYYNKRNKNWTSSIGSSSTYSKVPYKFLGTFKTEEEAAEAYNKAAIKLYGEFANLNSIE